MRIYISIELSSDKHVKALTNTFVGHSQQPNELQQAMSIDHYQQLPVQSMAYLISTKSCRIRVKLIFNQILYNVKSLFYTETSREWLYITGATETHQLHQPHV